MTLLWFVLGLVTGLLHATSLWQTTRSPQKLYFAPLRIFAIAGVLFLSTLFNGLLPSAAGWAAGFGGAAVFWSMRKTV